VIERNLDAAAAEQVNGLCAEVCEATVSHFEDTRVGVDSDSIYYQLTGRDVTLSLRDSTVVHGRLSGLRQDPDVWFIDQVDTGGRLFSPVQIPYASVDGILTETPSHALEVDLSEGIVSLDGSRSLALETIRVVTVRRVSRSRRRGFVTGFLSGALPVGLLYAAAIADYSEDDAGDVPLAFVLGGLAGGLPVGIIGALIGAKETTIYRFRPDTAQQVRVVSRVGPTNGWTR
jgi:hypothetical protein